MKYINGVYDSKADGSSLNELRRLFEVETIGAVAVFNSQAHLVVHQLKAIGKFPMLVCGYGTNYLNVQHLKDGNISFLIEEHPEYQGYMAVKAIVDNVVSGKVLRPVSYTPINIMFKETVDYFLDSDPTVVLK